MRFLIIGTSDTYTIEAEDTAEARHWITNHLDLSKEWTIAPAGNLEAK